jgi:hypothetical protein
MQPYFFPYIGYFQLINAVDIFVIYNDVNYIKGGWINRNKYLAFDKEVLFTIPLENSSSFSKINTIKINQKLFPLWRKKFLKSISQSYNKATNFNTVYPLIEKLLEIDEVLTTDLLNLKILKEISIYLNIKTQFIESYTVFNKQDLKGQDRVIALCKHFNAKEYINAIGGSALYDKTIFKQNGIKLSFIKPNEYTYKQFNNDFIPWLSIIDVLMFNSSSEISTILDNFKLV